MAVVPGYNVTVLRNGSTVEVKSGSWTREPGEIGIAWELTLAEPMNIVRSDTWTIKRKVAGKQETIVSNAYAKNIGGSHEVGSVTRRVSGDDDEITNPLLEYCTPITLCFVNWAWVQRYWPDAMIKDGTLVHGSVYSSGTRIYHDRLPGKEFQTGMYEVIAGCYTHHACAQYLASLVGYDIEIGIPDIPLVDTFTVASGTTWYEAIKKNLNLWFPVFEVIDTTIYVHDICADEPDSPGKITLTTAAIQNASLNYTAGGTDQPLDHLIITGRRTENSEALLDQDPDFTPIKLSAVELSTDHTESIPISFTNIDQYKSWGAYTGTYGDPDDPKTKKNLKTCTRDRTWHIDETTGKPRFIPLTETVHTYNTDDTEIAKHVITYTYSKGFKVIKTVEDEYAYCHLPGSAVSSLRKVRTKTTLQNHFIKSLDLTLTTEITEGLILYDEDEKDGTPYKDSPRVFADELRQDTDEDAIDTDADTTQNTLEDTISYRTTQIERTHDNLLVKRDFDYNKLSDSVKMQSQILENPKRGDGELRSDDTYRKEYHPSGSGVSINGLTCYHALKTINHDDITGDEIADQIAVRAFIRKDQNSNDEWSIKTPVPFFPSGTGFVVTLPNFPGRVNGNLVTVTGGDYILRQAKEDFSIDGTNIRASTTLNVRAKY